jgi:hypothetical protein
MKEKSFEGTAVTNAQGAFQIPITVPGSGPARLMLYYFGPDMASSSAGPIGITLP